MTQEEQEMMAEIVFCLKKYQGRYHKAPHAQRDWERSKQAIEKWNNYLKTLCKHSENS